MNEDRKCERQARERATGSLGQGAPVQACRGLANVHGFYHVLRFRRVISLNLKVSGNTSVWFANESER